MEVIAKIEILHSFIYVVLKLLHILQKDYEINKFEAERYKQGISRKNILTIVLAVITN